MVEPSTVNRVVIGSNPIIPALRSVEQLAAQLTVNQPPYGIGGSNPSAPTKCRYRITVITSDFQSEDLGSIPGTCSKCRVILSLNHESRLHGGLAQLARVLALHARGHRFESDILHFYMAS